MPDGSIPVLLSADTTELLHGEVAALLSYATEHPAVEPQAIADMLFRTRLTRRHRALAMVTGRDEMLGALRAVLDGLEHPTVVHTDAAAMECRLAYVFPGQGAQRPGMGRLFYASIPAFRTEVDRCAAAFANRFDESPLEYLLDEHASAQDDARTVQPALFTQMAGLAATWRSFGITPKATVGHSQGEIAAAYVAGMITLDDAASIVGIRAHAADEFESGDYAMAVVASDRDTCEDLLARRSGWAQLSVINSPGMVGISGDRETVQDIVDTLTDRGTFARVIRVHYPAHTSVINALAEKVRAVTQRELQNQKFLDTDIDCLGATLGTPITPELSLEHYWFLNLRNTVRFDKAIAAAVALGIDTYVELAEHPTLQLAIEENLAVLHDEHERTTRVVGTSQRTATDLREFTRNLAQIAVHDLNYRWECLGAEPDGPIPLPLTDFPNTRMREVRLWQLYRPVLSPAATPEPTPEATPARLFVEKWVRLSQRSLVAPRAIGIVDHTGSHAELASALQRAAEDIGATARQVDADSVPADLNTLVILLPHSPRLDDYAAAAEVTTFFSHRTWWPGVVDAITDYWLMTIGGETVVAADVPPDPVHAAASAGFRSIGADHPGKGFKHLDLPAEASKSEASEAIIAALHTGKETELALRNGGLYAKRIVEGEPVPEPDDTAPEHALIIGGTGNLGLEFCDHFARRGARRITLVSRSGDAVAGVTDRLREIRSATTTDVRVARCDVSDEAAVVQLAAEHCDTPADLIIHAAVDYSAVELSEITAEKVDRALRAKVVGIARVLETYPRTDKCRVVLCSSARATIGGRGQVVYAAANRMLDAMAHRLRTEGLDCVSVQWGQWTVHFDLDATSTAQLDAIGVIPMKPADALALGTKRFHENAIILAYDFDRARPILEAYGYRPLISQLTQPESRSSEVKAPAPKRDISRRLLGLLAAAIGEGRAENIDTTMPMVAIGLDSLQALELRRRVKVEFDHDLEVSDLLGGATIADVLAKLGG
ncbi:nocobactin polyketide synthase NbtC [Mycobacterium sp. 852002-51163_SCH5372311]|uniref:nocobactin polyketide synthase NbtC n=1 Tax=Mycobacterium sp. 852002-51163_SCH5372311 TaxID=1834097 RepID=UPI0035195A5F